MGPVPNWVFYTLGAKLGPVPKWVFYTLGAKLGPVPNCPPTLFEVRYHLRWPGGGWDGQNCPNFIRDDPDGSSQKEKILTKIVDKT